MSQSRNRRRKHAKWILKRQIYYSISLMQLGQQRVRGRRRKAVLVVARDRVALVIKENRMVMTVFRIFQTQWMGIYQRLCRDVQALFLLIAQTVIAISITVVMTMWRMSVSPLRTVPRQPPGGVEIRWRNEVQQNIISLKSG